MFANKIIGGEKKFRGPTDEAGASGQSFRMEGIDQSTSNKLIPETIAFYSSKMRTSPNWPVLNNVSAPVNTQLFKVIERSVCPQFSV